MLVSAMLFADCARDICFDMIRYDAQYAVARRFDARGWRLSIFDIIHTTATIEDARHTEKAEGRQRHDKRLTICIFICRFVMPFIIYYRSRDVLFISFHGSVRTRRQQFRHSPKIVRQQCGHQPLRGISFDAEGRQPGREQSYHTPINGLPGSFSAVSAHGMVAVARLASFGTSTLMTDDAILPTATRHRSPS